MNEELRKYFNEDELAVDVWKSKYQLKDSQGKEMEDTPDDMHRRLAKEFARIDFENIAKDSGLTSELSEFGKHLQYKWSQSSKSEIEEEIYQYFANFNAIVPQGSIMSILGNPYKIGSLSNCFVIPAPHDSYGGICYTDEQMAQLMKRRGGVGTNLNTLRPSKTIVRNAAGTSTGAASFMERYSNTTREVAQDGRRGALMLLMDCRHPDIFKFTKAKQDRTKVTGANISVMFTDNFMNAAKNDSDFYCRFPIDADLPDYQNFDAFDYNILINYSEQNEGDEGYFECLVMKIHAKELYDLVIEMAWENAEPGIAFTDRIINYSPDGVYSRFQAKSCNPCGEIFMGNYDSCRLMALNLFSIVDNPFYNNATINYERLYQNAYTQQRLADDLVDLEVEYVSNIIEKIKNDPEPIEIKRVELELWQNVLETGKAGRRTGCGFTALADMLAAVNIKYDSEEGIKIIRKVCYTKMQAELDCTIDLAILRGSFEGWNSKLEYPINTNGDDFSHGNDFYEMLRYDFPDQVEKMQTWGRRNVSFSTVAPTGTVSMMTQTSSGLEPIFLPYYMRRKKINPNDKETRVDFQDQSGDCWQEFAVLHPKFKDWLLLNTNLIRKEGGFARSVKSIEGIPLGYEYEIYNLAEIPKSILQNAFEKSPWFGSTANDIDWIKRVEIQSVIQYYTTHSISSTINLPNTVSKEEVSNIYWKAWEMGLKGVTVYRDGCRSGVLVSTETNIKEAAFSYKDATKRPKTLDCDIHAVTSKGTKWNIIVGLLDNRPYEVFAIPHFTNESKMQLAKVTKKRYDLILNDETYREDVTSEMNDEQEVITRLLSTAMRHSTDVTYLVDQLNKTKGSIVSFDKAIARVLSKYTQAKETGEICPECSGKLRKEESCTKCISCGYSKCG